MKNYQHTKIVATIGPACHERDVLEQMIDVGLDVCRLNFSHGQHSVHQRAINLVREINRERGSNIALLVDLQGPKIRIGDLDEPVPIAPGQIITFCTAIRHKESPDDPRIPMVLETFARDVKPGDTVLVNDGKVELRVLRTDNVSNVELEVINGDEIGSRKGVNLPYVDLSIAALTPKDRIDLELALQNRVEWVALSFVRSAQDIHELRQIIDDRRAPTRIIAKIEKPEALDNIDAIIAATDAIMVARGDLGVEIATEEVPMWQKRIIRKCNAAGKPVIVATQMLESMIEHNRPTRAEATDVLNAVLDGADAVMLSGETSVGRFPVAAVETMNKLIREAEREDVVYHRDAPPAPGADQFYSDVTCLTACRFARELGAAALVGMTRSGYTAFALSKHRPKAPIFIFTDNIELLNQLNLVWGVRAFHYDSFVGNHESIMDTILLLKERGLLQSGDLVVNTAVMPLHSGSRTNMIKYTVCP